MPSKNLNKKFRWDFGAGGSGWADAWLSLFCSETGVGEGIISWEDSRGTGVISFSGADTDAGAEDFVSDDFVCSL